MTKLTAFIKHPFIAILIFYGWNLLGILSLILLEGNEHIISDLVRNVNDGYTPLVYLIQVILILAIPIVCFIVGMARFGRQYGQLLRWFYGVEVPLLVLGIVRIAAVNDLSGHAFWFFLYVLAGVLGYAGYLLFPQRFKGRAEVFFRVFFFFIALQVIAFLLLYIVPVSALFIKALRYIDLSDIGELIRAGLMAIVIFLFAALSGTLFVLSPIAFSWMWLVENSRALWCRLKTVPQLRYVAAATLCVVLWAILPARQSQETAFETYETYKKTNKPGVILENEKEIKEGLVNAYLNSYRYLAGKGQRTISELYDGAFGREWRGADHIQDFLLDALLYNGEQDDDERASVIYQELFDAPIERAESKDILYTLGSAFQPTAGEATILSVDQKQVLVTSREISYKGLDDGWVQVDFHERYINKTTQQQEIFYYFSMPPSGTITGMWLGDDDVNPREYEASVSPRGAAQAVYKEIRRVRQDPALLEQVGPNQFRLRVFPIPARQWRSRHNRSEPEDEEPMHLTLRLMLKCDAEGKIEFPVLNEKRKVYWEESLAEGSMEGEWFPKTSPVFKPSSKNVFLFNGWKAEQKPMESLAKQPVKENYVLCYDGSFSMNANHDKLTKALAQFPYKGTTPLYMFDKNGLSERKWDEKIEKNFLGAVDPYQALKELKDKHPGKHLLYVSDKGSYELMPDSSRTFDSTPNTMDIIHLGEMAPIYEDAIADAVRHSGGDMYVTMESWISWHDRVPSNGIGVRDGNTYWTFSGQPSGPSKDPAFAVPASRLAMAQSKTKELGVSEMDSLHKMAMEYSFVSPYSSMICLVNDEQKARLEELSKGEDRYQREVETGKDSGNSFDIGAKGVPEPEEWVMIILGAGGLIFLYWREKRKRVLMRE